MCDCADVHGFVDELSDLEDPDRVLEAVEQLQGSWDPLLARRVCRQRACASIDFSLRLLIAVHFVGQF
jgi:hypothetical protein